MGKLIVHNERVQDAASLIKICPFGAMDNVDGRIEINAACRLCKLCVKRGAGVFEYVEETSAAIDKSNWRGIAVYVDHVDGKIHPVTYELIGKARELAAKTDQSVYAIFIGGDITQRAEEILHYGVDKVYVCDRSELGAFNIENYAAAFEVFINKVKPSAILVGATPVGRQLAPRVAARFRTGLTAD
ncbi:MAG: electron transfer flavoprotein subunit alpha, partial [Selenomonadaceae bacterium]|nr:electron transfer flavoprotein subunit alpha [Selenomonadaceae bacterium]